MKVLKHDSELEKAFQEVEDLLRKHEIKIEFQSGYLLVDFKEKTFMLRDIEQGENVSSLPRWLESERFVLYE